MTEKYKCNKCFDTGCSCGGIGISCHGCCSCEAGKKAQENRINAMKQILDLFKIDHPKDDNDLLE
jgi:hypothetical protein